MKTPKVTNGYNVDTDIAVTAELPSSQANSTVETKNLPSHDLNLIPLLAGLGGIVANKTLALMFNLPGCSNSASASTHALNPHSAHV